MAYNNNGIFTAGICLDVITRLSEVKRGDLLNPLLRQSKIGYLESMVSPLNTQVGVSIEVQRGTKIPQAVVRWMQRTPLNQIEETRPSACDSDVYPDFNEEVVPVTKYVSDSFKMKPEEFRKTCEGDRDTFIQMVLAGKFDALARKINRALLDEQLTNFGVNINTGTSAARTLTVFPEATGSPNARPIQKLMNDYNVGNELVGSPIIVGAGNMYDYVQTLGVGCCNDAGINMAELAMKHGFVWFTDNDVKTELGQNDFIMYEPGSMQFLSINEYVNEDATNAGDSVARSTIRDPKRGITYDIKILQDDCTDEWTILIWTNFDVWYTPIDQFHPDDPLRGSNGILRYEAITS